MSEKNEILIDKIGDIRTKYATKPFMRWVNETPLKWQLLWQAITNAEFRKSLKSGD